MILENIRTVAVLGAGTMGNGIAHVFARSGYDVILRDVEAGFLDRAMGAISKNLDREIKKGKVAEGDKRAILGGFGATVDFLGNCPRDFVIEAVPERLDVKFDRPAGGRPAAASRSHSRVEHLFDIGDHAGRRHGAGRTALSGCTS